MWTPPSASFRPQWPTRWPTSGWWPPEQEANFVGILAAVTSGDPVYQYSGYLMGLIQLCNALAPVDRAAWQDIVQRYFTQELADDWNANNAYWAALASPMEDAAEQVYDSF